MSALPYLPHEIDAHPDAERIWATLEEYGVSRLTHIGRAPVTEDEVDDAEDSIGDIEGAASAANDAADDLKNAAYELKTLTRELKKRYLGKAA